MNLVKELMHGTRQVSHGGVKARASEETEVSMRAEKGLWVWCEI